MKNYIILMICSVLFMSSCAKDPVVPTSVTITNIKVLSFPPTNSGGGWDLTSGADIYPELYKDGVSIWESSIYREDASATTEYTFVCNQELTDPQSSGYSIRLYDYDITDLDDYIGGYSFTPFVTKQTTTKVVGNNQGVEFELSLSYTY